MSTKLASCKQCTDPLNLFNDHFRNDCSGEYEERIDDILRHDETGFISIKNFEGILVFDCQNNLVYGNKLGHSILDRLSQRTSKDQLLPDEVAVICSCMWESRRKFSRRNWLVSFKLLIAAASSSSNLLEIHAKWIRAKTTPEDFLMLKLEDHYIFLETMALEEARRYGFTDREQDVWLLHRRKYTYKEIAKRLGITPNTVKKHIKSILAKQRAQDSQP